MYVDVTPFLISKGLFYYMFLFAIKESLNFTDSIRLLVLQAMRCDSLVRKLSQKDITYFPQIHVDEKRQCGVNFHAGTYFVVISVIWLTDEVRNTNTTTKTKR